MITTQVNISYERQTVPPIVPAVQGDSGRNIICNLTDYTIPNGATANFYIQKPSGEAIYNVAEISENTIILPLDAQCLAEIGENHLQVRVFLGGEVITSFEIILLVKKFYGMDAIESETEMNIFDKAVEEAIEKIGATLDPTLTQANKAAEAKAVGDRFAETDTDIAAVNAELENIAEPYGMGRTGYFVGDIYEKDGELYVAQVAKIGLDPIDFTASDFYAAKLSQIVAGNTKSLAYPYDKDVSYNTGDLAVYLGGLKQCKANGVTGAYDPTKWKDVTINKIINDQKAEIDAEITTLKNDLTSLGLSVVDGALCVTYTE